MQKLRTAPIPKWIYALALAGLLCCGPAAAQDTLPDSNGELKDFRLDSPPPKEKAAEPAPKIEEPAAQPVIKTAVPQAKPVQRPKPEKPPANAPVQDTPPLNTDAPAEPVADTFSNIPPPTDVSGSPATADTVSAPATAISGYAQYWPWLAAALAALLGFLLLGLWKRRRAPAFVAEPNIVKPRAQIAPSLPPVPKPAALPSALTVRFDPADARLSVANLTVKGHLHLRYDGEAPLETLKLRTRVMSACDGQKGMIDAFHSDPAAGQIESLGRVVPGEEINLTLEMQVPRDALQAFDWRERRFVAPIVLINIAADDGTMTPCRVSCVVGQDGKPGSARLQPIPIDRGPKLFGALQFRPIAA